MTRKNTRRALFSSAISLLLCCSMLIGTTFAWFTDEVTSTNNIIQSGNLDVELYYQVEGQTDWTKVTKDTNIFMANALWEPGHTEVVKLKVVNEGTLALKYQLGVNVAGETGSVNVNGAEFKLSDYIKFAIIDGAQNYTREQAVAAAETPEAKATALKTAYQSGSIKLYSEDDAKADLNDDKVQEKIVTMVVYMPTTVGNDANYAKGKDAPKINLGLNLLATQLTHENDSFNNDFDAEAPFIVYDHTVSDLAALRAAFEEGGNILLADDITFDKITAIEPGVEVYLNLNGKTITVDKNTTSNTLFYVKDGAKLIIDGDGVIDMEAVSTMAMFAPYGELVINSGTFVRDEITTVTNKTTGLFMGAKTTASNVTINGGYFDSGYYNEEAADIEAILAGTKKFDETTDDIAKRGNSNDANKVRVALKDNVSALLNHSGYGTFKIYGGTFVGANPAWGDEGCMLPTTPLYLRPWSYYQGGLLDGQTFNENGIVLPEGYTITNGTTEDGRPTYTVNYSK